MTEVEHATFLHGMEQFQVQLRELSRVLASYRKDLMNAGVPEEDALELMKILQHDILEGRRSV